MLDFHPLTLDDREKYLPYLQRPDRQGCEYNFVNLYLWGRQKALLHQGNLAFFSQFDRKTVYPFPIGQDIKPTLDAIIQDAAERGIPCRLSGVTEPDRQLLEGLYPGKFRFHFDRNSYDYIYAIEDLAFLKGRKYQRKRNHINRFTQTTEYSVMPLEQVSVEILADLAARWYEKRSREDPTADTLMEQAALRKALRHWQQLGMEGMVLTVQGEPVAMTLGSFINTDTFDVGFEKAVLEEAYPVINWEFSRYLHEKYPALLWLNREEDMGLEGLRKAKLSYNPHHLVEKCWACLLEDCNEY